MDSWNGFDFFVFLIFAVNTLLGMSRAAAKEIISMMCLSVALIVTIKFTIPLTIFFNKSPLIIKVIENKNIQNFMFSLGLNPLGENALQQIFYSISLLVCFVGTFSICESALAMSGILEVYSFPYAWLNRKLGAMLGGVRGYVITLILISITVLHVFKDSDNPVFKNSFFINLFRSAAIRLDGIILGQRPEQYQDIYKDKNLYDPFKAMKEISKPALEGVVKPDLEGIVPTDRPPEEGVTPATNPP